jgi:hypothetical protein
MADGRAARLLHCNFSAVERFAEILIAERCLDGGVPTQVRAVVGGQRSPGDGRRAR